MKFWVVAGSKFSFSCWLRLAQHSDDVQWLRTLADDVLNMIAHGELVCDSDAEYFEWRHSLNARQTWRRVGSTLTAVTEGNNNFFRLVAVKHEVIGLSPVLYVVELRVTRVLVSCWDDDVRIVCILAQLISRGRRPQVRSEALTTYDTGPIAEPYTMLAEIWHNEEVEQPHFMQCEWPVK